MFTVRNDRAWVRIHTILPERAAWRKIGGAGREFEVEGVNYAPHRQYDADEAGRWRLEVEASEPAERTFFLHVLEVAEDPSRAPAVTHVSEDEQAVTLALRHADGEALVTFSKNGDLAAALELRALDGSAIVPQRALPTAGRAETR
jgi:hypothetical protein